jgi:hypothetical protein
MRDPSTRLPMADADLEAALRDLGDALAISSLADRGTWIDPAARARARIAVGAAPRRWRRSWLVYPAGLPLRRAVVLAVIAVLAVAIVAAALGLGLPGIRIVSAPTASARANGSLPSGSPAFVSPQPTTRSPATSGQPGSGLGLGDPVALADVSGAVDFPLVRPTATGVGPPATAWILEGRLSLVWPATRALPETREPAIGLILSEFRGSVDPGYFRKVLDPATTTITAVDVDGVTGYWISGAPHTIVFVDRYGQAVFDSRRIVGDTLLWARGDVTYRLESGLDQAAAIALAATLR